MRLTGSTQPRQVLAGHARPRSENVAIAARPRERRERRATAFTRDDPSPGDDDPPDVAPWSGAGVA
jgi:hypothetical protein